jgi:hypothetical protein
MPTLTFRIKKRPDTSAMLVLVREDGSSTSESTGPPNGYGPMHDLARDALIKPIRRPDHAR